MVVEGVTFWVGRFRKSCPVAAAMVEREERLVGVVDAVNVAEVAVFLVPKPKPWGKGEEGRMYVLFFGALCVRSVFKNV